MKSCNSLSSSNSSERSMSPPPLPIGLRPPQPISTLSKKQVDRLRSVLNEQVEIHGRGNFPTLSVRLLDLIGCVRRHLIAADVAPKTTKINGGAASYIMAHSDFAYSDLDLIFCTNLDGPHSFDRVRQAVFSSLIELLPAHTNKNKISSDTLKDIYIRKMVKVNDDDRWSLFSLHNDYGRCIELKFADKMRRQFEFSVDSFQITLDPLLNSGEQQPMTTAKQICKGPSTTTVELPPITVESMYGDIHEALRHLNDRLIDTKRPEQIRGGGLLKYCHLLTRGYRAARAYKCRQLERYMCSRFFIDFPDLSKQENKLQAYMDNHFGHATHAKYEYLLLLYRVIAESTVCLMTHERKQTLEMVDNLAYQLSVKIYWEQQGCCMGDCGHVPRQQLFYLPRNATYWIPVA